MRKALVAILAVGGLAGTAAADPLATVGKKTIDRAEVEKLVRGQLVEIETQRYDVLKSGLDQLVAESLFEQEAAARGMTTDEFEQAEIVAKIKPPTDAEIKKVYEDNKEQLGGAPLEEVKDQIVEYLLRRHAQERHQELVAELKKKYPTKVALKPPVVDVSVGNSPVKGDAKAPVTIIEFSDYECPYCKRVEPTVQEVLKFYGPEKVRFAYRNFPLPFHSNARPAAEAAACAGDQGKFWEYHEKLIAAQDLSASNLQALAGQVGLDKKKFDECVAAKKFKDAIDQDVAAGEAAGVNGTPAFFVNGRVLDGALPVEKFKEVIDEELTASAAKT